jgi:hypothetical protein
MSNIPIEEAVDPNEVLKEMERLAGSTSQSPDAEIDGTSKPEDVLQDSKEWRGRNTREVWHQRREGQHVRGDLWRFLDVSESSADNTHFTLIHSPSPACVDPNPEDACPSIFTHDRFTWMDFSTERNREKTAGGQLFGCSPGWNQCQLLNKLQPCRNTSSKTNQNPTKGLLHVKKTYCDGLTYDLPVTYDIPVTYDLPVSYDLPVCVCCAS